MILFSRISHIRADKQHNNTSTKTVDTDTLTYYERLSRDEIWPVFVLFHRHKVLSPRFSTKLTACGKLNKIFVNFFMEFSFIFQTIV